MTTATDALTGFQPAPRRQKPALAELIRQESRRKRKRRLLAVLFLLAVPVLAIGAWAVLRPKPVPLSLRFRTGAVTRGDIAREVQATGRLEAITTVQVGAEISARIDSVEVDYNDRVTAGQVLARFDRVPLAAQAAQTLATLSAARVAVEQAKIDRAYAAREAARAERLFVDRVISERERDNAAETARIAEQRLAASEAELAAQAAANALAKANLGQTIVRSPIDGIVITRNVDPGQTVASMLQTPVLFTVAADLRKMHVIAAVDEADIGEVAVNQRATFTVNAYPNRIFEGVVKEVRNSPDVVQDVVTYGAEVEADNTDLALKPGMTATVHIRTAVAKDVLRVPAAAFEFTPPGEKPRSEAGVWLLSVAALRRVKATPGVSDGELTAVVGGALAQGDKVVFELTPEGRKAYGIGH